MSDETRDERFSRRLAAAYGAAAGCPPPEVFLAAEWAALPEPERRRIEAHAASCPACAAERELAREFDAAGPEGEEASAEDVAYVVRRLEALDLPRRAPEPVIPAPLRFPERPEHPAISAAESAPPPVRRAPFPAWGLAAAAALAVALGVAYQMERAAVPPLGPAPAIEDVRRGSEVAPLAPVGEVAARPAELSWEPVRGARSYRVTLRRGVDDAVLWQGTVPGASARLPQEILLHPAVVYWWSVEALDARGAPVARSEAVSFRVRPEPEAPSKSP